MSSEIIFSHADFISRLLEKSYVASIDCYQIIESNLFSLVHSGGYSRLSGQPSPEDEKIRDSSKDLSKKYSMGSVTQRFYVSLSDRAEVYIRDWLARDEEMFERGFY